MVHINRKSTKAFFAMLSICSIVSACDVEKIGGPGPGASEPCPTYYFRGFVLVLNRVTREPIYGARVTLQNVRTVAKYSCPGSYQEGDPIPTGLPSVYTSDAQGRFLLEIGSSSESDFTLTIDADGCVQQTIDIGIGAIVDPSYPFSISLDCDK